jgi:hypothetical protein
MSPTVRHRAKAKAALPNSITGTPGARLMNLFSYSIYSRDVCALLYSINFEDARRTPGVQSEQSWYLGTRKLTSSTENLNRTVHPFVHARYCKITI